MTEPTDEIKGLLSKIDSNIKEILQLGESVNPPIGRIKYLSNRNALYRDRIEEIETGG